MSAVPGIGSRNCPNCQSTVITGVTRCARCSADLTPVEPWRVAWADYGTGDEGVLSGVFTRPDADQLAALWNRLKAPRILHWAYRVRVGEPQI